MQILTWKLEDWRVALSLLGSQTPASSQGYLPHLSLPGAMLGKVVSVVLPTSLAQGVCTNIGVGQGSFWLSEWDMASHGWELGM